MKILLGISGSIAAYKAAFLVRLLVKSGAEVRVLMTPAATKFISPLTLSTLSKHEVLSDVSDETGWNNHVELGLWADAYVVAPATANTLAKMANGICDNILTACYLSARCPVFVAPAMDLDMWTHPSTQENVRKLEAHGCQVIPVGDGELASGLHGKGRLAEPEEIVAFLEAAMNKPQRFLGKKALVTAGPTFEAIDPVRFIGNRSTGKMGIAIAEELASQGAEVTLVLGSTHLRPSNAAIKVILVESAKEMLAACEPSFREANILVFAAAVADYAPKEVAHSKIKKSGDTLDLHLVKNPDIALTFSKMKRPDQFSVGFALETDNEMEHALSKLEKKNFDLLVLNSLRDPGAGFAHDTNKIRLFFKDKTVKAFELKSKVNVAVDIVAGIQDLLQ